MAHEVNISNPIEATYLALFQNIELQLMATWVYLSRHQLFVINLPSFKLFKTENTVFRAASIKHTDLKSQEAAT